jgi:hypothetical protein
MIIRHHCQKVTTMMMMGRRLPQEQKEERYCWFVLVVAFHLFRGR